MTFDADILADGKYYFRVIASGPRVQSPGQRARGHLVSTPVMIDNTPPVITLGTVRYAHGAAHMEWEAADGEFRACAAARFLDAAIGLRWKPPMA